MPLEYGRLEQDQAVKTMTPAQFGCYMRLLISCWHEGSLPNSVSEIESISTYRGRKFKSEIWAKIKSKFTLESDGKLHNKLVDEKRQEIKEKKDKQSFGGKKTAEKRWGSNLKPNSLASSLATKSPTCLASANHNQNHNQNKKESILSKLGEEKRKELEDHLTAILKNRGWDDLKEEIFESVLLSVSEYDPRNIYPYFKKCLQQYINQNAEWLSTKAKKGVCHEV